jgi:uncharacterized protein
MNWDTLATHLIRPLSGASRFSPQHFWEKASLEAREMATKALAPFEHSPIPIDYHAHLLGDGIGLHPPAMHKDMLNWRHPIAHIRYLSYLSAIKLLPEHHDPDRYIRHHMHRLVKYLRDPTHSPHRHYRMQVLAIDSYFTLDGSRRPEKTHFYVSNDYLMEFVREFPESFSPAFSVHPYRSDALVELTRCHELFEEWKMHLLARGILNQEEASKIPKMLKWLPNSMGIDPMHPRCGPFYERLAELNFILLSHTGEELAVSIDRAHQRLGNPLLLRKAVRAGVTVIVAHCAALGKNPDLDNDCRLEDNLTLFLRMMNESLESPQEGSGKLYGDLSALSIFLCQKQLCTLLEKPEIHHRLLNGSDYPIPAINPLVHLGSARRAGMLTGQEALLLREIYDFNPLLMDIVFKRTCRHPKTGRQFPVELFTRFPG